MWYFKHKISFKFVCMCSLQFIWAVGAKPRGESLIITTGQLGFCKNLMLNLKIKNLEMFLLCLTSFSKWAVVQQLHVVTPRFVLQYVLTCEVNVLKFRPIIYFDKTNVNLIECFCFWVKWKHELMVIYSNAFFLCALQSVHTADVKMNLKKRGKRLKRELLMERNAPCCELDPTHVVYK